MYIDKGKAIVGLIQCDVVGLMVDGICDGEIGRVFEMEGWGNSGCRGRALDVVDEALSVADEQRGHVGEERDGERDGSNEVCSTAVFAQD